MFEALQIDLLKVQKDCRCGGQLFFDGTLYSCSDCCRLYCPECYGIVVASGGCYSCLNCGWGLCR